MSHTINAELKSLVFSNNSIMYIVAILPSNYKAQCPEIEFNETKGLINKKHVEPPQDVQLNHK